MLLIDGAYKRGIIFRNYKVLAIRINSKRYFQISNATHRLDHELFDEGLGGEDSSFGWCWDLADVASQCMRRSPLDSG